jgi:hypothetical protein
VDRRAVSVALLLGALLLAGCSDEEEPVPVSCRQGPDAVRSALRDAPGRVSLGGTPLSACITDTTGGGPLQEVGQSYLAVASSLADDAARDPNGVSAMRLGYLMGAVQRSRTGAQGVGSELGRRLQMEAARVDSDAPAFRRGERAGRRHG